MMVNDKTDGPCKETCRLSQEEREWLHTARKYIDSKHLPTLGKALKALDEAAYTIGKAVIFATIIGGLALLFWWFFMRSR